MRNSCAIGRANDARRRPGSSSHFPTRPFCDFERSLEKDRLIDSLAIFIGEVQSDGLNRPDAIELVEVHLSRGPSLANALFERIQRREVLAERPSFQLRGQFTDSFFDDAFFLIRLLGGFAIREVSAPLGEVVQGAAEFVPFDWFSGGFGSQLVRQDVRRVGRSVGGVVRSQLLIE